jgi:cell division protein FtsZ
MAQNKRASMREGPLAALFSKTEEEERAAESERPSAQAPAEELSEKKPEQPSVREPRQPSARESERPSSGEPKKPPVRDDRPSAF